MKTFVITGPSSCGKTAIINKLAAFGHPVLHEAARELIREERVVPRSAAFQEELAIQHIEREQKLINSGAKHAFLDRGIHDVSAFSRYFNLNRPKAATTNPINKYTAAFFLEPLDQFKQDGVRIEKNLEEALQIGDLIRSEYQAHGIKCIDVPKMNVEKRVEFILRLTNEFIADQ